jgi:CubicO group peptidase (beta-lactamase class C family)
VSETVSQSQTVKKLDNSQISFASLDNKIQTLVNAGNVHGLAIAIFNNNEPVYKKTFGYKRIDYQAAHYDKYKYLWRIVEQSGVCRFSVETGGRRCD